MFRLLTRRNGTLRRISDVALGSFATGLAASKPGYVRYARMATKFRIAAK
jgi:hypothetical protein